MTASSGVVLSNLAYLIGAVVLAIIGGLIVWLRHRQPKSVDANVESFSRGLRALAPDPAVPTTGRHAATTATGGLRIRPTAATATVTTVDAGAPADGDDGDDGQHDPSGTTVAGSPGSDPAPAVSPAFSPARAPTRSQAVTIVENTSYTSGSERAGAETG
jgi:hypothetical protein